MAISMKGKKIDLLSMAARHAGVRAVGNAQMNARGDRIGPGGVVIKSREQIDKEILAYHRENPNAVRSSSLSALETEVYSPEVAASAINAEVQTPAEKPAKTKKVITQD